MQIDAYIPTHAHATIEKEGASRFASLNHHPDDRARLKAALYHRFCEADITEPDPGNENNWFFLSGWPDTSLPGTDSAAITALAEAMQSSTENEVVPDDATCATSNDRGSLMLCGMGLVGIAWNSPDGLQLAEMIELPDGTNMSTSEVNWLFPTSSVKTFHPRSLGHLAYRDLVRGTW
jgi:hypothetical protein